MKELDFLPPGYHLANATRREWRKNFVLSLLAIASLAGLHQVNEGRIRTATADLQAIDAGIGSVRHARDKLTALSERKSRLSRQAALAADLRDKAPLDAVIAEMTAMLNNGTVLRAIEITTRPPEEYPLRPPYSPDPHPSVAGAGTETGDTARSSASRYGPLQVLMTGIADGDMEVGMFYGRLGSSSRVTDLHMNYTRETELCGRQMREFEIGLAIRPVEDQP
ncbi:MAG TPA: hypothetical protein PKY77_16770 [Phycisphaerae bacterium]|nr:hypothetical protein [Phycisphaerae bacterium]HRY69883.1 hypothetical protein [Phycisphaerae bacterium]HSA25390.1 hypothetical protein [Phycisphaerae bacterium]